MGGPTGPDAALESWRARATHFVLIVVAVAGLPAYAYPLLHALRGQRSMPLLWVYAGAYATFVALVAIPGLNARVRAAAFLAAGYANAAASLARLGLAGSGRLYLLALPAMATILVGPRAGYAAAAASAVLFGCFAGLAGAGVLSRWLTEAAKPLDAASWIETGVALATFILTLVLLVERFHALHARTLAASRKAAADLEELAGRLREREERLDLVVRGTNDGIWDWNLLTDEVYFSPRWKSMLGFQAHELPDSFDTWRGLLHPDDVEQAMSELRAHLEGHKAVYELEHRLRCRDGSYRWILTRGIALRDGAGRAVRMVGAHTDVSERRRTQAELAAAYATLEQRVSERTRELAVLNSVAEVVSRSLDLSEIMSASLEKITEAVGMEAGAAYRLEGEEGQETLVMMAHRGLSDAFVSYLSRVSLAEALAGAEAATERPIRWNLEGDEQSELGVLVRREGLRLMIGAPVISKNRLLGGFVVGTRTERPLSDEESSLLMAIGRQVGVAVENARLFDLERARHQEAERGRAVAEGMRETLAVLNSQHTLEQTLSFIVSQACRLMGSDAASLLRIDPAEGSMRIQSACGLDADYVAAIRFSPGRGGAGRALAQRQPLVLPDAAAFVAALEREPDPLYDEEKAGIELMLSRGFAALLSVPLVIKDEDYGGITLYWRRARAISKEEIELAMGIADQAALAIENARLRTRAEEAAAYAERSRLAGELHDSVTQSLYSVTLYAEAVSRLLTAGDSRSALTHLQELRATAQEALREMRLLIFQLNPPKLEESGLAAALQKRLDSVERRGGLDGTLEVEGEERLEPELARELYLAALEALNNVVKHARARRVTVRLRFAERAVRLEIADDGVGFDVAKARRGGGLGLRGLQERARRAGGTLELSSAAGAGTRVAIEVGAG